MDENTNGIAPDTIDERRKEVLYDVLFSGGNIEWYYGYNPSPVGGDLDAEDFRNWESMWQQMRYAREMMESALPFWRMSPADSMLFDESSAFGGAEVFAAHGEVYAIYIPDTNGVEKFDLSDVQGSFNKRWFNPRTGQYAPETESFSAGSSIALGRPPSDLGEDWVVLLSKAADEQVDATLVDSNTGLVEGPQFLDIPNPTVLAGDTLSLTLRAVDNGSSLPSVSADALPAGMVLQGKGNGQLLITWQVPETLEGDVSINLIAIRALDPTVQNIQAMTIRITQVEDDVIEQESQALITQSTGALVLHAIPSFHIRIGQSLVHRVQAEYTDGVPPNLMVWNAPKASAFYDNGDGTRTFLWTPTQSDIGIRTLTFVAQNIEDPSLVDSVDIEVLVTH